MRFKRSISFLTAAVLLLLALTGCGSYTALSEDVRNDPSSLSMYIHDSVTALAELGVDASAKEDELTETLLEILEDPDSYTEKGMLLGFVLTQIYYLDVTPDILAWDTEVFEIESMYTDFLEAVNTLSGGELGITGIVEDNSAVNWDRDSGEKDISFTMLGKDLAYSAPFDGDWMDVGIVAYLNDQLEDLESDKRLYVCSDGYQGIILFYNTPEWCEQYNKSIPELPLGTSVDNSLPGLFW